MFAAQVIGNQAEFAVGGEKQRFFHNLHHLNVRGSGKYSDAHVEFLLLEILIHPLLCFLDDLNFDIRVDGAEGGQKQGEPVVAAYLADSHQQRLGGVGDKVDLAAQRLFRGVDFLHFFKIVRACVGQRDGGFRAVKQFYAQFIFQTV